MEYDQNTVNEYSFAFLFYDCIISGLSVTNKWLSFRGAVSLYDGNASYVLWSSVYQLPLTFMMFWLRIIIIHDDYTPWDILRYHWPFSVTKTQVFSAALVLLGDESTCPFGIISTFAALDTVVIPPSRLLVSKLVHDDP